MEYYCVSSGKAVMIMNGNGNTENTERDGEGGNKTFRLPTVIVFMVIGLAAGIISALDPIGAGGAPFSVIGAAMICSLALASGEKRERAALVFSCGAAAFLVSLIVLAAGGREFVSAMASALLALLPTALALPIYLTVRGKSGRAVSIGAAAVASTLLLIVVFSLRIYALRGAFDIQTIKNVIDECFEPFRKTLSELSFTTVGGGQAIFSESDIEKMIYSVEVLLPGTLAAMMIVMSYLTTVGMRLIAKTFDVDLGLPVTHCLVVRRLPVMSGEKTGNAPQNERPEDADDDRNEKKSGIPEIGVRTEISYRTVRWRIELDSVSAVIFIVAYFFAVLFGSSDGETTLPLTAAAQNLIVILTPGFVYAGIREVFRPSSLGAKGCLFGALALVLTFVNPMSVALLFSVVGVTTVLRENHTRKMIRNNNRKD